MVIEMIRFCRFLSVTPSKSYAGAEREETTENSVYRLPARLVPTVNYERTDQ